MTPEDFRRLLVREGLVADSALPLLDEGDSSPWFVRLLAGAGAWLAALFLYGAIAAVAWPLLGSAPARLIVGLVACAGCALATRLRPEPAGVFLSQLLLATSLAGFLLVLAGASEWAGLVKVSLLAALLAAILLPANPEPIHRQAMALTLVAALAVAATDLGGLEPLGLLLAASTITLTGQHAYFDKAREVLMRVSSQLQGWFRETAEQLGSGSVWIRCCEHLKRTLAANGPPQALRLLTCHAGGVG